MNAKFRWLCGVAVAIPALFGCGSRFPDEPVANRTSFEALRGALEEGAGGAAGAASAALPDPTGWASLRGTIKVTGAVPAGAALTAATTHQDAAVCAPGGKAPAAEDVMVGPGGGLAGVAVYLNTAIPDGDAKWLHESYASKKGTEVAFDQKNCMFLTHVAGMWTAQTLKVLNSDPVGHNTKIDSKGTARPFNQTIGANGSTTYEPGGEEREPMPVSCSIHTWMKAYLLARNNPYFAITDASGAFEIANIPAGVPLEFRVWQPKLASNINVDAQVNGASQKISKGRLKVTLNDGQTAELNASLDASLFQ